MKFPMPLVIAMTAMTFAISALADSTIKEDAKDAAHDVSKTTKKTVRSVQDETCKLVHGKMHCLGQKIKHKAKNAADDIKSN